jgi:hypothetical protein
VLLTKNSTIGESVYNEKRVAVEVMINCKFLMSNHLECYYVTGQRWRRQN